MALVMDERNRMGWVRLTPWFAHEPWRAAVVGPQPRRVPAVDPGVEPGHDRHAERHLGTPASVETRKRARAAAPGRETRGGGAFSRDG